MLSNQHKGDKIRVSSTLRKVPFVYEIIFDIIAIRV